MSSSNASVVCQHAKGAKLTDLLGMTAVRYPEALTAADMRAVNQKLRKATATRETETG
jgi:hypothetical protein